MLSLKIGVFNLCRSVHRLIGRVTRPVLKRNKDGYTLSISNFNRISRANHPCTVLIDISSCVYIVYHVQSTMCVLCTFRNVPWCIVYHVHSAMRIVIPNLVT